MDRPRLTEVFRQAVAEAEEMGAEPDDALQSGVMNMLRTLAWEMDALPLPKEQIDKRTVLIQYVLNREGEQNG